MKEIIIALIPAIASLAGIIITVRKSNAQMIAELKSRSDASDAKLDKEVALLRAEVDELMREVRMHNNFAQRMPVLEKEVEHIEGEILDLKKRGA